MTRASIVAVLATTVALAAGSALAQSAKTTLTDPAQAKRFNDVSDRLVCQCGCQMILRVCNHQNCPSAVPMRREIERQILQGRGDDEIVQSFVDEHGLKVLSSPPTTGFNLAAWIMPGFAVLVGLLLVVYFAANWFSRRRAQGGGDATEALSPEMRARIERELNSMGS